MHAWLAGLVTLVSAGSQLGHGWSGEQNAGAPPSIEVAGYDTTVGGAEGEAMPVAVLCDAAKFRLSVRIGDASSLDRSYPTRTTIYPESLVQPLPSYAGDMQYRGQLIRYLQCGPYSVRLTGDFYNANVQGELGAYPPFLVVEVFADNRMLVPDDARSHVAIGRCARENRRGPNCPEGWAVRLDLDYDRKREKVVVREQTSSTRFDDDAPATQPQVSERRYEAGASLNLWEHARDARKAQASGTP